MQPLGPLPALADDAELQAEDLFSLVSRQKVTAATLSPIPVSKTPGTVSIVTQKEIREMGASSLDEVLAHLPGVDVRSACKGNVIDVRTFGADVFGASVELLIDGAPYNSPETGGVPSYPSFGSFPVPVEMIQQVEVIREPISSLYGDNALHGVINVITKSGADFNGAGEASARAGARALQRYAGSYGGGSKDLNYSFGADYLRQAGPLEIDKAATLQDGNAAAKLRYKDLTLAWFTKVSQDSPFSYAGTNTGPEHQLIELGTLAYDKDASSAVSLHAQSSFLTRSGSNCQVCHNSRGLRTTAPADHEQSVSKFTQEFRAKLRAGPRNEALLGLQYDHDSEAMPSGAFTKPFFKADNYSAFAQDKLELVEDKLSLTLGLRQDYSKWSNAGGLTSPRALLVYTPTELSTLRAGLTRAHRVPSYMEEQRFFKLLPRNSRDPNLGIAGGSGRCGAQPGDPALDQGGPICDPTFPIRGDYFFMGNPGLKPADIDTANLGIDHWINHKLLVKVNGYFSKVTHSIDEAVLTPGEFAALTGGVLPNGQPLYAISPVPAALAGQISQAQWNLLANSGANVYVNNPSRASELGGEVEVDYRPFSYLQFRASYDYKHVYFDAKPANGVVNGLTLANPVSKVPSNAPVHYAGLSVTAYPSRELMVNVTGKYRGPYFASSTTQALTLPPGPTGPPGSVCQTPYPGCLFSSTQLDGSAPAPGALFLDFNISYRLGGGVTLSLIGSNMFNQAAQEWREVSNERLDTGRDLFVQARLPFGG